MDQTRYASLCADYAAWEADCRGWRHQTNDFIRRFTEEFAAYLGRPGLFNSIKGCKERFVVPLWVKIEGDEVVPDDTGGTRCYAAFSNNDGMCVFMIQINLSSGVNDPFKQPICCKCGFTMEDDRVVLHFIDDRKHEIGFSSQDKDSMCAAFDALYEHFRNFLIFDPTSAKQQKIGFDLSGTDAKGANR